MTKRILHIIPTLDHTGAAKQLCLLAQRLPRNEFQVHVCALSEGGSLAGDLADAGVPLTVIGKRWQFDPRSLGKLIKLAARFQPDLIHTWVPAASIYGYVAGRACGVKTFVASQQCIDPWKSKLQWAVDRALARRYSRIVVNSEGVRDFSMRHGMPAERMQVIPNGVALSDPPTTTRRQLLTEWDLPHNSRLIGLIGSLESRQRVKDAIWAVDLLKVIRDDVHLLIIGDGPQRDRLRHFRDQIHLGDKVHFLDKRGDVPRWLSHLDALWSTSGYEGQSNAILEAMAAGVPVVATDIPGTRDLVLPGVTGYLVPVGQRAGFAKYTERLLNDPALVSRFSAAGRDHARNEFNVEKMVSRYAETYREVLA